MSEDAGGKVSTGADSKIETSPLSEAFEYKTQIRESHLDTFGHVNNAAYLILFEEARWEVITSRGFGIAEIQRLQLGPTILEINLKFRREIKNREIITIRTEVSERSGKVTTLKQTMLNSNGEDACIGEFKIALFDLKARRLIEPTKEWNFAIGVS